MISAGLVHKVRGRGDKLDPHRVRHSLRTSKWFPSKTSIKTGEVTQSGVFDDYSVLE